MFVCCFLTKETYTSPENRCCPPSQCLVCNINRRLSGVSGWKCRHVSYYCGVVFLSSASHEDVGGAVA